MISSFDRPRAARRSRTADAITEVFAPGVINIALALMIGWHTTWPRPQGLWWGLLAAAASGIVPYGWIIAATWRGRLGDRHVRDRAERSAVVVVILASVITGLILAALLDAPGAVTALLVTMLIALVVTGAITHYGRWKISFHTAVSAGAGVILTLTRAVDQRHPAALDRERVAEFAALFEDPAMHEDAVVFPGDALVVDTSKRVTLVEIEAWVRHRRAAGRGSRHRGGGRAARSSTPGPAG
jgi:hypothetical protein